MSKVPDVVMDQIVGALSEVAVWQAAVRDNRNLVRLLRSSIPLSQGVRQQLALLLEGKLVPRKRKRGELPEADLHVLIALLAKSPLGRAVGEYILKRERLNAERKFYGNAADVKERIARKHGLKLSALTKALTEGLPRPKVAPDQADEAARFRRWQGTQEEFIKIVRRSASSNGKPPPQATGSEERSSAAEHAPRAGASPREAKPGQGSDTRLLGQGKAPPRQRPLVTLADRMCELAVWRAADGDMDPLIRLLRSDSWLSAPAREQLALLFEGKLVRKKRGRGHSIREANLGDVVWEEFYDTLVRAAQRYKVEAARLKLEGKLFGKAGDLKEDIADEYNVDLRALNNEIRAARRLPNVDAFAVDEAAEFRRWLGSKPLRDTMRRVREQVRSGKLPK